MLTVLTGVMTLALIGILAGRRQTERRSRARGEYYALFYGRRANPPRSRGLFFGEAGRCLIAPLFRTEASRT